MRLAAAVAAILGLSATASAAAPPSVAISATLTSGAAPLRVVLTASGDAAAYHWDFGDGSTAEGVSVEHVFGAGSFAARVTGTNAAGETATAAIRIRSYALRLRARGVVGYGGHLKFRGRLIPATTGLRVALFSSDGARVARGWTRRTGIFSIGAPIRRPGTYTARFGDAVSNAVVVRVRPRVSGIFVGAGIVGRPLRLALSLRPVAAGPVHVEIRRGERIIRSGDFSARARLLLPSTRAAAYRIRLSTPATASYAAATTALRKIVAYPRLSVGSHGPSVLALNEELHRVRVAVGGVDSSFGLDTRDAVVAFQKLHGLPRTGTVDAAFWRRLTTAKPPHARYPYGNHIEVSKPLQVLFVVRSGRVVLVSHVSTGATGNTPTGRWHVYSKTPGWLASGMFDSSFFLRGFALHGYPSVPFYPASHGCVRLPVWLAPRIYALAPYGSTVYVY